MTEFLMNYWDVILDSSAKAATIIAAIGLWVAFRQYRHTVVLAEKNERRAAIELAARECARFGDILLKELGAMRDKIEKSGCEYMKHCKVVKDDQSLKLDSTAVTEVDLQKMKEHGPETTRVLNLLEGFAIPFASGVADDGIGFIECGRAFARIFEENFSLYGRLNLEHYYRSSQTIYWRWRKRIEQEELERQHLQAGKAFFVLSEKLVRGKSDSWAAMQLASLFRKAADMLSKP